MSSNRRSPGSAAAHRRKAARSFLARTPLETPRVHAAGNLDTQSEASPHDARLESECRARVLEGKPLTAAPSAHPFPGLSTRGDPAPDPQPMDSISQQQREETALRRECEHALVVSKVLIDARHGVRSSMCARTVPAHVPGLFGAAGYPGAAKGDAAGYHARGAMRRIGRQCPWKGRTRSCARPLA